MTGQTVAEHAWLRRVSDYHSGGVSEAERAAVEAHLATCADCRQALAVYQRFYVLARSPLRLGPPSPAIMREQPMSQSTERFAAPPGWPRPGPRMPRRRLYITAAARLAAALVVAGFLAVFAGRLGPLGGHPSATATHGATPSATAAATSSAQASPSPSGTTTTTPYPQGPFVCANPPGSNAVYAFRGADDEVYWVQGCGAPHQLTHAGPGVGGNISGADAVAWSPSNRYLAIMVYLPNGQIGSPNTVITIADTQTGTLTPTQYHLTDLTPTATADREFIGWLDDDTFLGAVTHDETGSAISPADIVRVNIHTQAETRVMTIAYAASLKIRAGFLFYGGYASSAEKGAHLHRVNLTTGADTTLVPLGLAADGGCQGYGPCNWTAPWDVTPDGQHVVYHNPGPTTNPSDTHTVPDTPLYYGNLDGSGAVRLFADVQTSGLVTPLLSPDGTRLTICCFDDGHGHSMAEETIGGADKQLLMSGSFQWRGDSRAIELDTSVVNAQYPNGYAEPQLINVTDGTTTPITLGTYLYVWGN